MDSDLLKNSLFKYAFEGKLTKHNLNDSSEELYQQIQKERNTLIKNKIIKNEKIITDFSSENVPYKLPENWKWVKLGTIISLTSGRDLTPNEYNSTKKGIPYITGASNIVDETIIINRWTEKATTIAYKNEILLTCKGTIGKTAIVQEEKVHIARQIMSIKPIIVNTDFINYYLQSLSKLLKIKSNGIIPGISRTDIINQWMPLPPLKEQSHIVLKLNELLPLVEKYRHNQEQLDDMNNTVLIQLKKSILNFAIKGRLTKQDFNSSAEDLYIQILEENKKLVKNKIIRKQKLEPIAPDEILYELPENWKWVRLGELGIWQSGATPSRSNHEYYGGDIPWLKTGDLNDGIITEIPENITKKALNETSVKINPKGSVLIAMYGATIGKLGILSKDSTTNQACCALTPYKGVYNWYIFYCLMANRENFIKLAEGGAQPNISKEKIIKTVVPLPPYEEQVRIVTKIEELLELCNLIKNKI